MIHSYCVSCLGLFGRAPGSLGRWLVLACALLTTIISPRPTMGLCAASSTFVYEDSLTLPVNARGVAWWGAGGSEFLVERRVAREWSRVAFDVLAIADSLTVDVSGRDSLLLLCPREPWKAGDIYRFRDLSNRVHAVGSVTVQISSGQLAGSRSPGRLKIVQARRGPLRVAQNGLSPSRQVDAGQLDIRFVLPREFLAWDSGLLVSTRVDGRTWRPAASACGPTPPGTSWMRGWGSQRLYCVCEPGHQDEVGALSPGHHTVQMTAWLPGTDVRIEGRGDVVLECQ
jgi:hypothetical protein